MNGSGVEVRTDSDGRRSVIIEQHLRLESIRQIRDGTLGDLIDRHDRAMLDAVSASSAWCLVKREQHDEGNSGVFRNRSIYEEYMPIPRINNLTKPEGDLSAPNVQAAISGSPDSEWALTMTIGTQKWEKKIVGGVADSGWTFLPLEIDLSAQQPVPPAATNALPIPQTVNVTTGNAAANDPPKIDPKAAVVNDMIAEANQGPPMKVKLGHIKTAFGKKCWRSYVTDADRETDAAGMARASEAIIVASAKADELDAAMLRECRGAIAKLREWPRCVNGDHALNLSHAIRADSDGEVALYLTCEHESVYATRVQLSPATHRMLGAQREWMAP